MATQQKLDAAYIQCCIAISKLSYAERKKVGAIVVANGGGIISEGYNGTPSGFPNQCETNSGMFTLPEVLHAESNAIAKIARSTNSSNGATLYVTMSPCFDCAKMIIQCGIKRVVYLEAYRDSSGVDLLQKAEIKVEKYDHSDLGR